MSKEWYIAVDCGKYDTKYCYVNDEGVLIEGKFRSKADKAGVLSKASGNTMIIKYGNVEYLIGSAARRETDSSSSKNSTIHQMCILAALARIVDSGDVVNIAIGCPIDEYIKDENRTNYERAVIPMGQHTVVYNRTTVKHIIIKNRICIPESMGILYTKPDEFISGHVGIVDIGGLNFNACYIIDGNIASEMCFSDKKGLIPLRKTISNAMNTDLDYRLPNEDVEKAIRYGYLDGFDDIVKDYSILSKDKIEFFCRRNIEDILTLLYEHEWNINISKSPYFVGFKPVFVGGTSQLLKKYILEMVPKAIIPEGSEYSNAEGYLAVLRDENGLETDFSKKQAV